MDVPLAGLGDAEDPEAIAIFIFDLKIVAGFVVAFPPLAADALGADGVEEAVDMVILGEGDGAAVAIVRR